MSSPDRLCHRLWLCRKGRHAAGGRAATQRHRHRRRCTCALLLCSCCGAQLVHQQQICLCFHERLTCGGRDVQQGRAR
jgi:hypothetical protein